jgi:hypothetical protein
MPTKRYSTYGKKEYPLFPIQSYFLIREIEELKFHFTSGFEASG